MNKNEIPHLGAALPRSILTGCHVGQSPSSGEMFWALATAALVCLAPGRLGAFLVNLELFMIELKEEIQAGLIRPQSYSK